MGFISILKFIFSKAFWVSVCIYIILLVIGCLALLNYLDVITLHGNSIKVPYLGNYHVSELDSILKSKKLNYVIADSIFVEKKKGGIIIEQSPDSGSMVKEGRKIYLTMSAYNAPKVTLPNLQYDDKRNAIAQFQSVGFKIGTISYVPSNCLDCLERVEINDSVIKPGKKLNLGSSIDLVFGGGKSDKFIPVPKLIGLSINEVSDRVLGYGLVIGATMYDTDFDKEDSLNAKAYRQIPDYKNDEILFPGSAIQVFFTVDSNKMPKITIDTLEIDSLNEL